ncbi:glutamine--fructose-6-phosphate transaminase (isomerizing) [Croceicoccus sp. F390]|uniref:Glutamine--fructose-6-phosphate aminotransferase [isomerizing] n=1 Tax=Croceicoccus esteveae TaxID=3075597 RepID=A0ABU2ZDY5_9SPHN|nr:glutamine--fructose-6-phosphate transaminase (isomerizing) [Croceicoccus sp. F390]MDT0574812.1 glutamine--fructose-6-phosphate transaminase (isomerizing) [Croceicoccus sp. F390]
MCGIIAIVGQTAVADRLIDGLRRMEYRGYDSAGLCTLTTEDTHGGSPGPQLIRRRAEGKLANLVAEVARDPAPGNTGIAHTRWATHGAPTRANAHPHATPEVALVHNGIIENYRSLRAELAARGRIFQSETDSEVVAHLVSEQVECGATPWQAVQTVLPLLRGAFALAIVFRMHPGLVIGARQGSPLVVGFGDREAYLGSDALALAALTQKVAYLEEGDRVMMTPDEVKIYDSENRPVSRPITFSGVSAAATEKGNYRHFMQKEIFEQPIVVAQTLTSYIRQIDRTVALPQLDFDLSGVKRITIVACGTSYYAGMVAKYWFEHFAHVPVDVDVASEFRYRDPVLEPGGLALFVSQSGETADTLAALRHCRAAGQVIAVVVNVPTSSMAREADLVLPTHAGPEIGVASTKAFTCQLAVLAALAARLARVKGRLDADGEADIVRHLLEAPACLTAALDSDEAIASVAQLIAPARDVLYMGRGPDYPLALEGALKLKEISYIHAEGYASGEMKHGPIALVDDQVPIVVIAPSGPLFDKTISNMHEMQARGGRIILVSDAQGIAEAGEGCVATLAMPRVHPLIAPLVYAVPVQLLAYHTACIKGTDVDQPRNLAKSVTVE